LAALEELTSLEFKMQGPRLKALWPAMVEVVVCGGEGEGEGGGEVEVEVVIGRMRRGQRRRKRIVKLKREKLRLEGS